MEIIMKIFRPEDYGAIADGIHNDATALWSAIAAACDRGEIAAMSCEGLDNMVETIKAL